VSTHIRDITVIVDGSVDNTSFFAFAARFAAKHQAHVSGVHVIPPFPGAASAGSGLLMPQALIDQYHEGASSFDGKLRSGFEDAMNKEGVRSNWVSEEGDPFDICCKFVRHSDFAMARQPEPESGSRTPAVVNHLLLHSGRPVLVVPYIGSSTVPGKSIVVAWDGGAPAARAANDAIEFLRDADDVEIVYVDRSKSRQKDEKLGASVPVSEHFARHGIETTATTIPNSELDPGTILLNRVADRGADMIVAGAWGHSRAGELLFGGTTRTLLQNMTVPVFLSH